MGSKRSTKKVKRQGVAQPTLIPETSSTTSTPGSSKSLSLKTIIEWAGLAIASTLAYWFLTARLTGVTVSVLKDEYVYVLDAHYKAFTESGYPNHLFQLVYSGTKSCGADFYECARGINAIFVVASALVVYLLAVHISKNRLLGVVAWAGVVFGTFGTYTAYFMPEAVFNFLMVLFIYLLIRFGNSDNLLVWSSLGTLLGVAALAKPHALFLMPAIVIYIILSVRSNSQTFFRSSALRIGFFLTAVLASKLGLGYLIAGQNGFSLFGSYGYAVSSGEAVSETLGPNTWLSVPQTASGQTLMIVMVLGVALPVALVGLLRSLNKNEKQFASNKFRTLFGISLVNMMAVSALFEAWQNLGTWMHTRYYSYLIPLAVVVLIEAYSRRDSEKMDLTKRITVGIFFLASGYVLFTQATPFGANWIDAPDFAAHIKNIEISSILIVSAMALSVFWLWNSKASVAIAIAVSLFASSFAGLHITTFINDTFGKQDAFQQNGRLLSNYLPQQELDKMMIFGDEEWLMQRILFYSLSGGAATIGGTHQDFDKSTLGPDARWLLVYGEPLSEFGSPHLNGPGYQLYSLSSKNSILPRNNELSSFSNACIDAANASWVCGSGTALKIDGDFPTKALVDLVFEVGDSVAGTVLEFSLGGSKGVSTVTDGRFAISISFQNGTEARELLISSPTLATASGIEKRMIRLVSINVD